MLHNKVNIFNNTIMLLKMAKRVHFGLVFCDCAFHSVCPLMDEDKKLMEAS